MIRFWILRQSAHVDKHVKIQTETENIFLPHYNHKLARSVWVNRVLTPCNLWNIFDVNTLHKLKLEFEDPKDRIVDQLFMSLDQKKLLIGYRKGLVASMQ